MQAALIWGRFEFTIGEDVIPYFLGKQCFDDIVLEIIAIGKQRKFDKLFIGCDENIRYAHLGHAPCGHHVRTETSICPSSPRRWTSTRSATTVGGSYLLRFFFFFLSSLTMMNSGDNAGLIPNGWRDHV